MKENLEKNEDNEQTKLFVIQFPRQIPIKDLKNQEKIKEEENEMNNQIMMKKRF